MIHGYPLIASWEITTVLQNNKFIAFSKISNLKKKKNSPLQFEQVVIPHPVVGRLDQWASEMDSENRSKYSQNDANSKKGSFFRNPHLSFFFATPMHPGRPLRYRTCLPTIPQHSLRYGLTIGFNWPRKIYKNRFWVCSRGRIDLRFFLIERYGGILASLKK